MSNAILLIIGNEILSGKTQDTNLKFLGTELARLGIELTEARVIRDDEQYVRPLRSERERRPQSG